MRIPAFHISALAKSLARRFSSAAPIRSMLTTTLTPFAPARRTTSPLTEEPLSSSAQRYALNHLLRIDLCPSPTAQRAPHDTRRGDQPQTILPIHSPPAYAQLCAQIRELARAEAHERAALPGLLSPPPPPGTPPPVDAISLVAVNSHDPPSPALCSALSSLRPRVLELSCDWEEYCSLSSFDALCEDPEWKVEELIICGACGSDVNLEGELLRTRVRCLRLHVSHNLPFPAGFVPEGLRELVIEENDVLDSVCRMVESGGHWLDRIERLKLRSTNGCDLYNHEVGEFLEALETLQTLKALELELDSYLVCEPSYTLDALADHVPQGLEELGVWGSAGIVRDPSLWVERIRDERWLPRLRKFGLRLDLRRESRGRGEDREGKKEGAERVERVVMEAMRQHRRAVELVET